MFKSPSPGRLPINELPEFLDQVRHKEFRMMKPEGIENHPLPL